MRIRSLVVAISCLAASDTTACLDFCHGVEAGAVGATFQGELFVGDTSRATAYAETMNEFCPKTYPSSAVNAGPYHFKTSDPTIASVNLGGLITALSPGKTSFTVSHGHGGYVASYVIYVARPIERLEFVVTPPTPKVGDTVLVVTQAIDSSGTETPGANFVGLGLQSSPIAGGTPATSIGYAADRVRFVVNSPGQYTVTNGALYRGAKMFGATVTIDVP